MFSLQACAVVDGSTIILADLKDGVQRTLQGHSSPVYSVSWSPDGRSIVSGSHDNSIKVWDVSRGTCTATLTGHSGYVWSVS